MRADEQGTSPAGLWHSVRGVTGAFADYAGWRGFRATLLVGLGALLDGIGVLLLVPIINIVVGGEGHARYAGVSRTLAQVGLSEPRHQLVALVGGFVALGLARAVIQFLRDTTLANLQIGFIEAERNRAMRTLSRASWERVVSLRHARVTNLITTEITRLSSALHFLIQGSVLVATLVIHSCIAFALAPGLALFAMVLLALIAAAFLVTQVRTRNLGVDMVRANQALMGSAGGFLSGLKTAAAQNAQASFVAEFESIQQQIRASQYTFQMRHARTRLFFLTGAALFGALVVVVGFAMLRVPAAILITMILVFGRMSTPAMQLFQAGQQLVFALPSFESVRGLEAELGRDAPASVAPAPPPPGAIELAGASFLHPSGRGIEAATLTIAPGSFAGIAGPSGAGKTTLVDLIIGLIAPQQGSVIVGGVPLDGPGVRAGWADEIAYVSQEGFLFHDTLRRNLCWANPEPDADAIAAALDFVGATDLVARMEQGLETVVGERGTLLSGGERQRIVLARALLRRPRLLVLDEAANAIDAAGEAALLDRLAAMTPRPTILMISHRAESLRWCDQVIRVEAGRVLP